MRTKGEILKDISELLLPKSKLLKELYCELGEIIYKNIQQKEQPRYITTSTGHKWIQVPNGYKDVKSGLVWKDKDENIKYTHDDALNKFGNALPTKEEFETAEAHSIREVIGLNSQFYWSLSVFSNPSALAWRFSGASGNVSSYSRGGSYSVRCLAR